MTTTLVTGGAGFIGSNLVHALLEGGARRVVVLDRLTYAGNLDNLAGVAADPRFELVHGDICDGKLVRELFEGVNPDVVYHLAAESHVDRSIDGPREFIRTNLNGTFELLDAALGFWRGRGDARFRFVHVSTDEVYGSLGATGYFTETSRYEPNSPYAASKAGSDHLVRAYAQTFGLPAVTTNCSNNYGPFQFPEKLIPLVTLNALEGKPLPVYGDGKNVRDWLYVRDHCEALMLAASAGVPGEVYNIGGRCEKTTLEVVEAICDALGSLVPGRPYHDLITFVADRPGHDKRYAVDPAKIGRELGWTPRTSFDEAMRRTVAWYVENLTWCDRITSGVYQRERLGLAKEAN